MIVKAGSVACELESENLQADFPLLKEALELALSSSPPAEAVSASPMPVNLQDAGSAKRFDHGMNTYVAKFKADTARKIMQVAGYSLCLKDGKDLFTKSELYSRVREAKDWRADYANQQANNLSRMVSSGELTERSGGTYSVPDKLLEQARGVLSNG